MKDFFTDGIRTRSGKVLPFSLCIIVGKNERFEEIHITHLTEERQDFARYIYELEEFRPILMQANVPSEMKIYVYWDVLLEEEAVQDVPFVFTSHLNRVYVYDQNYSEEGYPWSCGLYAFYVLYEERKYWGAFQVSPKNLTNEQFSNLHQLIEKEAKDLAFWQEESHSEVDFDISPLQQVYSGLCQQFPLVLQTLIFGENLRNRCQTIDFLRQLEGFLAEGEVKMREISNGEGLLEWTEMEKIITRYQQQLRHRLGFMGGQDSFCTCTFSQAKFPKTIRKKSMQASSITRKVLKPTFLLYEYYCYFFLLQVLREAGYVAKKVDIAHQLFSQHTEQQSATIHLYKKSFQIDLVYNEVIEPLVYEDFPETEGLFSLVDKRRPDIRLDLFRVEKGMKVFLSTMIFEVKYSPIFNIYQKKMKTKVMEQLKKYRSMVYQSKNKKGRGVYYRNPVYEVICFYPGHEKLPVILDTPIALYIQNYPKEVRNGEIQMVGKSQVFQLIERWTQETVKKRI